MRRAQVLLAALVLLAGCASASAPPSAADGSAAASASAGASESAAASVSADFTDHRAQCLQILSRTIWQALAMPDGRPLTTSEVDALTVILEATLHERAAILFTDGAHDFVCVRAPGFFVGDPYYTSDPYETDVSAVDGRAVESLGEMVVSNLGWSGGTDLDGYYVWGVASPAVARVEVIPIDASTDLPAAPLAVAFEAGYWVAFGLDAESPCCVFRIVAYDAEGTELGRIGRF